MFFRFWRVHFFHEVSSSRCQSRLPPSGDRFTGKVCLIHLNCVIRFELEAMGQKTLYVKGVFLVIIRCVAVEGMLGEIIFVGQKRTDTAKLQDALAAIQHGKLIHAHQLFATLSSDEFKKTAAAKKNLCGCRSNWRLEAKKSPVVPGK